MMDKIQEYIIKFALFEKEPLQIVLGALLDAKIINNAHKAIQPILELIQGQYLECYHDASRPGDEYVKHNNLTHDELIKYIETHAPIHFEKYPEFEYYLQTTEKGMQLFPDEWEPLS